jgi:hypothetical protein
MSAAGIISLGINNLVIGFTSGVLGFVIDFINGQTIFFNLSYGTLNTMNFLTIMFWIFPFTFFIMSLINYIIVSANEAGGWA